MISLYPHQEKFIHDIRAAFQKHKSVLAHAPVGFGKTIISAWMGKRILEKKNTMFFCVHTKDLLRQTYMTFHKFNLHYGIIAAQHQGNKSQIQICSMNTLQKRLNKYKAPSLLIVDEAHFACAKGWAKVIEYYKAQGSYVLGLSASPWRLSGEGLGKHFDVMIHGPATRWLIDNKYLSEYRIFAPSHPNLENVHIRAGDFVQNEIEPIMNKPSIVGDAITHYKKHCNNKKTIAFCCSVEHSKFMSAQFNANGITASHLDGECDNEYRKKIIKEFADGRINVITNCALFSAGFDLSLQVNKDITVEAVMLLRPTASLSLFIQMTGRALRYKTYPAIILDHANCCSIHGLIDDDRQWTLEGRDKKKDNGNTIHALVCKNCFAAQRPGSKVCKFCGYTFEVQSREIEQKAGELSEVDITAMRRQRMISQGKCQTFDELLAIAKKRGYKRPYGWVQFLMRARQAKRLAGV